MNVTSITVQKVNVGEWLIFVNVNHELKSFEISTDSTLVDDIYVYNNGDESELTNFNSFRELELHLLFSRN